jgi:uncharacterized protein
MRRGVNYASRRSGPAREKACHFCRDRVINLLLKWAACDTKGITKFMRRMLMSGRFFRAVGLAAAFFLLLAPARAQTPSPSPSPDSLAAAKELIGTMNMAEQFKAIMPSLMKTLKPAIVQGRSEVDRDYDAMTPILLEGFQSRLSELMDAAAIIYASNFTADDLHVLTAFYKTPTGQKLLQKTPVVALQTITAGQKFGQSVAADMQKRIIEELRKKGHAL